MTVCATFKCILLTLFLGMLALPLASEAEPDRGEVGKLTLDGLWLGMSYGQVLATLGRPKEIREEGGLISLLYAAPPGRPEGQNVWFSSGRLVFGSGYTLEEDEEPLFLFGMPADVLEERFGATEPLNLYAHWWPRCGVVLYGMNALFPDLGLSRPIGLRDPDFPIHWDESPEGKRWSKVEPWVDDEAKVWMAEEVTLGMPQERAQILGAGLDIGYEGGFVRELRAPQSALLSYQSGHHDLSVEFEVGQAPRPFGVAPTLPHPQSGWFSPSSSGRIRMEGGKVAEIQLRIDDDALFQALAQQSD